MMCFEQISWASDMWSLGVHIFIMLSGTSPYFDETSEDIITDNVRACLKGIKVWDDFQGTSEAKKFLEKIFVRGPSNRLTVDDALAHKWLSEDYTNTRKAKVMGSDVLERMQVTDERLLEEEEEEYIDGSFVFKTFDEEEYESPEDDEEE
jgi:serine/threonine protein kinase